MKFLTFLYDFLIPHWVTENVAYIGTGPDNFRILCCEDDLCELDIYDGIAKSKALSWLFWGFFATITFEE